MRRVISVCAFRIRSMTPFLPCLVLLYIVKITHVLSVPFELSVFMNRDKTFPNIDLRALLNGPHQAKKFFEIILDSEGSDQTAHSRSLIWAFAVRLQNH